MLTNNEFMCAMFASGQYDMYRVNTRWERGLETGLGKSGTFGHLAALGVIDADLGALQLGFGKRGGDAEHIASGHRIGNYAQLDVLLAGDVDSGHTDADGVGRCPILTLRVGWNLDMIAALLKNRTIVFAIGVHTFALSNQLTVTIPTIVTIVNGALACVVVNHQHAVLIGVDLRQRHARLRNR